VDVVPQKRDWKPIPTRDRLQFMEEGGRESLSEPWSVFVPRTRNKHCIHI
jgi:hypothetical protein